MCGIIAMYSLGGEVKPDILDKAVASLHHRGPDGHRTWVDRERQVALGHTRLSIIDLEGGAQPLCNEDETIHAVVNGELYDFERIRAELEAKGHRFRTRSDSEILLHLYEEYGITCVEHLRGEVAFALYDKKNDLLVCGRDRFGIKPLYYAEVGGVFMAASEAKALFAAGMVPRWDDEVFYCSTMLGTALDDASFFAGVQQVPAGHVMVVSRTHRRFVRYWDFDYPQASALPVATTQEHHEALRAAFDEAVRLRLRADVPVACFLSGGLDSCAILGFAARHSSAPIRAFTIALEDGDYNEEPIAKEMAARAGAVYSPVFLTQQDFVRDFSDALFHTERPLGNANFVAMYRLSRAVREAGIKVVLTGEGSDEIFAGYPHYRHDLFLEMARSDPARAQALLKQLEEKNAVSRGTMMPDGQELSVASARNTLGGTVPSFLLAIASFGKKVDSILAPAFKQRFAGRDPLHILLGSIEVSRQLRGRHVVHQAMYLWSKTMLPGLILSALSDRIEMAHSVEARLPFLDHHVVEVSTRLPIEALIRGDVEKHLLREVARPVLTDTVYRRQKHPFMAPPASATPDGPLHELMQDTLRGKALADLPFFEPKAIVGLLDMLPRMQKSELTAMDVPLMLVLSMCVLQQRFGISSA